MPQLDDDVWSVNSGTEGAPVDSIFDCVPWLILKKLEILGVGKHNFDAEFFKEIASLYLAVAEDLINEWFVERIELLEANPDLNIDVGIEFIDIISIISSLKYQFGIEKLETILVATHELLYEYLTRKYSAPHYTAAYLSSSLIDDDNVWYETTMLKALLKTLPSYIKRLNLDQADFRDRKTNDVIEIINAVPDHIAEINIGRNFYHDEAEDYKERLLTIFKGLRRSKLILKISAENLGLISLPRTELNAIMRVMPPRTLLRIQNISIDCCLQSKARALLLELLPTIETVSFKIADEILEDFLADEVRLQHLVDQPKDFIRHLAARKLLLDLHNLVKNNEFVFDILSIPSDAVTSDIGLQQFIATLENYQTSLSYLCCALLLSDEINCYFDTSKDNLDAEEYVIKRYADAVDFYKRASHDVELQPVCRHILSRIKFDLKLQRHNGTERYASFVQHVFKICNSMEAAPVLAWRASEKCKDYVKEDVTYSPTRGILKFV